MILSLFLIILLGVILTALCAKNAKLSGYLALFTMLGINIIIFSTAIDVFQSSTPLTIAQPLLSLGSIGAGLLVSIDKLSALFLVLIGVISLIATLFSIDYMTVYKDESLARFYPFLILFVAGMIGVVCVSDLFFFFVFWEFMTLASYALVVFERENPVALRAGLKYFIMTHIATALMFIAGLILQSYSGSFSFGSIGNTISTLASSNPILLHVVLGLFFVGFATKAGIYPFGTWLPDAHPAAPSGVSAILSGAMIKIGVYGFLRIFLYMLPATSHSSVWGGIIAAFGTISILIGTYNALIQKDAKRLLAFHSIGQIGYIILSLGIGIGFIKDWPVISAIALIAGLFHMVNHAFFKGLLFLNTGSIMFKSRTRDLNSLGGLWSIIPFTTFTAIIAALSISGFPPFNGFASKWLIYQVSIVGGIKFPLYILFGVVAIFVSALTMASFLKFLSTAFLGEVSETVSKGDTSKGIPFSMNLSQGILAGFCILLGLIPLIPLSFIYDTLANSKLLSLSPFSSLFGPGRNGILLMIGGHDTGIFRPLFITIVFAGCIVVAYLIFKMGGSRKRFVPVWFCGEEYDKEQVRYKAKSFYLPFIHLIERLFFPKIPVPKIGKPERIYRFLDFDRHFFYPLVDWMFRFTERFRKTHVGIPQVYMLWQVLGIILVVIVLFWFI